MASEINAVYEVISFDLNSMEESGDVLRQTKNSVLPSFFSYNHDRAGW